MLDSRVKPTTATPDIKRRLRTCHAADDVPLNALQITSFLSYKRVATTIIRPPKSQLGVNSTFLEASGDILLNSTRYLRSRGCCLIIERFVPVSDLALDAKHPPVARQARPKFPKSRSSTTLFPLVFGPIRKTQKIHRRTASSVEIRTKKSNSDARSPSSSKITKILLQSTNQSHLGTHNGYFTTTHPKSARTTRRLNTRGCPLAGHHPFRKQALSQVRYV